MPGQVLAALTTAQDEDFKTFGLGHVCLLIQATPPLSLPTAGLNWYLNQFIKVNFDWEHAIFSKQVLSTNGRFREQNDLFWVRTQVYF